MRSVNRVTLIGNTVRDPEIKTTAAGQSICTFSLATNRTWKNAAGEQQSLAEFHNLVVFGPQAEFAAQAVKKGKPIYVEGYLKTRNWQHSQHPEVTLYKTEVVVDTFILLSPREAQETPDDPLEAAIASAPN